MITNFYRGAALTIIAAAFNLVSSSAIAFTVTQNNNTNALLNALLGNTSGLSNFSITTQGNANAFGLFQQDPFNLTSGIILSTGTATQIVNTNTSGVDLSTDFGQDGTTDDSIALDISFDADSTANKLFFNYVFGSEEFVEWGGSSYNDNFQLLLNGVNLAKLSDGQTVSINNLVPNPDGPYHPDYINNPVGSGVETKLDGFTKVLSFEGLLNKNAKNTLSIRIADVGDGIYDSAVLIKGGSLGTVPTVIDEPGITIGLLAIGGVVLSSRLKHRKA